MPFLLAPASMQDGTGNLGGTLSIKYEKNRVASPECCLIDASTMLARCPDRTLLFNIKAYDQRLGVPDSSYWDETVSISCYWQRHWQDLGIKFYLGNYTANIVPRYFPTTLPVLKERWKNGPPSTLEITDSGGFQIANGRIDFLNPKIVGKWYAQHTDIGMGLDIPAYGSEEALLRSGKILALNNQIMLEEIDKVGSPTQIMNVLHGENAYEYDCYHDEVFNEKIDRIAVAGLYTMSSIDIMSSLIYVLSWFGKTKGTGRIKEGLNHYKHVHLLGLSSRRLIFVLARLFAKHYDDMTITCDAATSIIEAKSHLTVHGPTHWKGLSGFALGYRKTFMRDYHGDDGFNHLHMNCSCYVCSRVKYTSLYSTNPWLSRYFHMHSVLMRQNQMSLTCEMARTLDDKTYLEYCQSQSGLQSWMPEIEMGLRFIKEWEQHGLEKADQKFLYYRQASSLFWDSKNRQRAATNTSDIEHSRSETAMYRALDNFEKYHADPEKCDLPHGKLIKQKKREKRRDVMAPIRSTRTVMVGNRRNKNKKKLLAKAAVRIT